MTWDNDRRFGQLLNFGGNEVPVGEVIPFVPRDGVTRKPMTEAPPSDVQTAALFASGLDTSLDVLMLGYPADTNHYHAPEKDPA